MNDKTQAQLPPCPPDSPKGKLWRRWFERLGPVATVDVVNATAELVLGEREIDEAASSRSGAGEALDRYVLGDAIRRSYLKHGRDSWCSVADDVIAELAAPSAPVEGGRRCPVCGHNEGVDRGGQCIHKLDVPADTVAVWDDNHCGHVCDFSRPAPQPCSHAFAPRCTHCLIHAVESAVHVAQKDGQAALSPDTLQELLTRLRASRPASEAARRAAEKIVKQFPEIGTLYVPDVAEIIHAELTKD